LFSRPEAIKLGSKLQDLTLIQHVTKKQPFADQSHFYEFVPATFQAMQVTLEKAKKESRLKELDQRLVELQVIIAKAKVEQDVLLRKLRAQNK
jgi:hypothetical protein